MKKHFIYKYGLLLSVLIAIGCGSCQKDNYVQYDAGYASLRFIYAAEGNDSIVYSFALHPDKQEDIVEIPFKLVGLAVGQVREIGVEVVKEETTAQENDMKIEWILCPFCGSKTRLKIRDDTVLENFPLYCPKCKHETLIAVRQLNLSIIQEPDAKTQSR